MTSIFYNTPPSLPSAAKETPEDVSPSKKCTAFFREKYGYNNCVLTNSYTAALEKAAGALHVGPGDEVIIPSFASLSTANAFALRGAKLVFVDSDRKYPNVLADEVVKKVTGNTKAIVVVHYGGKPVDIRSILEKTENKIPIVEDCTHAIESKYFESKDYIGTECSIATFSFKETENFAVGDCGLVVINDKKIWESNPTEFESDMSETHATALWSVLQNKKFIQKKRFEIWDQYDKKLKPSSLFRRPLFPARQNANMYYLEFYTNDDQKSFIAYMNSKNISVEQHYVPLDVSPQIIETQGQPREEKICKCAGKWFRSLLRFPLNYDLTTDEVDTIIEAVNIFSKENGLSFVPAEEKYWEAIRVIRNDNAKNSFQNAKEIVKEDHWKFMRKHAKNYGVAVTTEDECVGFVGVADNDFRLAVTAKGRGVAAFVCSAYNFLYGETWDFKVLRANKRCLGFIRKFGYEPNKKAWAAGEDPVPIGKTLPRELWEF